MLQAYIPAPLYLISTIYINISLSRGTSILGEMRNVEISGVTQLLICSKSHLKQKRLENHEIYYIGAVE